MSELKSINLPLHPIILEDVLSITSNKLIHWDKLKSKTVLITGASGLIGSYLVYTLLCLNETTKMGLKVLALVRNQEKAEKQFADILERKDFELLVQDVRDPINYSKEVHYIIHAASLVGRKDFITNPVNVISVNVHSIEQLLEFARDRSIEGFMYISSREIYGEPISKKQFISENDYGVVNPTMVRSCYPESKRMAENICACYNHQYDIPVTIARLGHVYGPEYSLLSGRVWEEFIHMAITGQDIVLNSDGKTELTLTYVSDAVLGLFFALLNGNTLVYNIGSSEIISVKELAESVAELCPNGDVKVRFEIQSSVGYLQNKVAFLDSGHVEELGWKCRHCLKEGVERALRYFSS